MLKDVLILENECITFLIQRAMKREKIKNAIRGNVEFIQKKNASLYIVSMREMCIVWKENHIQRTYIRSYQANICGGADELENIQASCYACNQFKSNIKPEDFEQKMIDIFLYQMKQKCANDWVWKIAEKIILKRLDK